jgi:outer membrane protein assembly factor BamA
LWKRQRTLMARINKSEEEVITSLSTIKFNWRIGLPRKELHESAEIKEFRIVNNFVCNLKLLSSMVNFSTVSIFKTWNASRDVYPGTEVRTDQKPYASYLQADKSLKWI